MVITWILKISTFENMNGMCTIVDLHKTAQIIKIIHLIHELSHDVQNHTNKWRNYEKLPTQNVSISTTLSQPTDSIHAIPNVFNSPNYIDFICPKSPTLKQIPRPPPKENTDTPGGNSAVVSSQTPLSRSAKEAHTHTSPRACHMYVSLCTKEQVHT